MKIRLFGKFEAILISTALILSCFIIIFSVRNPLSGKSPHWKTYSDIIWGFSISYPGNWSYRTPPLVLESPNKTGSTVPEYSVHISVMNNSSVPLTTIANNLGESCIGLCPEEGGELRIKGKDYRLIPPKIETKIINGVSLYYVTTNNRTPFALIPLPADKEKYLYISPNSWTKNQDYRLFDQILSTFKYNDQPKTLSWQTYTNSNLGYSIQYPDTWFIAKSQITQGVSTSWLGSKTPAFNYFRDHNLEIIIGSPYIYAWSEETCANQKCENQNPFSVSINNILYKFNVTKVSSSDKMQFKYYTFQIENNQVLPSIIGTFFTSGQQQQIIQILSTFKPALPPDTSSWKTYNNNVYKYSLKYPPNYFSDIKNDIIKISNYRDFEKNEYAMVITIEPKPNDQIRATQEAHTLEIVNDIGYGNLIEKYMGRLSGGTFLGDPPWGYYYIFITANPGTPAYKMLQISVRIYRSDDMPTSEGGTAGQLKFIAKSIISTFKLSQ